MGKIYYWAVKSFWQIGLVFILFLVIINFIWQWMLTPVEILAGSVQLVNASLIKQGLIIHKDFWSKETPLIFYLNSWSFDVFGESVIAAKFLGLLLYILVSLGFWYYYRTFNKINNYLIAIATLLSSFLTLIALAQAKWLAYAIAFLGLVFYLLSCRSNNDKSSKFLLIFSGIITGLAILSKLNCGLYIFGAIVLGLFVDFLKSNLRLQSIKKIILFSLPVLTCIGFYLIVHLNHLNEVFAQILVFPGKNLAEHRIIGLSFREENIFHLLIVNFLPLAITFAFPLIWFHLQLVKNTSKLKSLTLIPLYLAIAIIPLLFIAEFQHPNLLPKLFIFPLMGIILCQLFFQSIAIEQFTVLSSYSLFLHYFLSRSDLSHYAPLILLMTILFFTELLNRQKYKFPVRYFYTLLVFLFYISLSHPYILLSPSWQQIESKFFNAQNFLDSSKIFQVKNTLLAQGDSQFLMSAKLPLSLPEAQLYPDQEELEALQFVYNQTNDRDYVYIGVTDHSQLFLSNIRSYWILGRKIGVNNYVLEPGLTTEKPIQEKMIAQLQNNHVNWIILWEQFTGELDFEKRNYIGSNLLDKYIKSNYILVKNVGSYWIYTKNNHS